MSFLSPWYLLGLLGIGIPLAIHLIRRQRAERVVLPTARFLKRAPKKLVYFQRIQQWLLLLLRIAIAGLLAVAFARPIITGAYSQLVGTAPQSLVILLDTSMSMQYADRFDEGKAAAINILESLQQGDEAAIVAFADSPGPVKHLTTDLTALETFVRNIPAPGYRSTHFLTALHLADQILQSAHYQEKTVVLVSDYQRSAAPASSAVWTLSPGIRFKGIKVGDTKTSNLTVTDVRTMKLPAQGEETHLIVGRIQSLGTDPIPEARVFLRIDGTELTSRPLDLRDRSEIVVEFPVTVNQAGLHRGSVRVEGDRFEPDNTRYFTVRVEPPVRVLCISGESAGGGADDKAYWFRSALGRQATSPFQVDVVDPQGLFPEALASYAVVVLMNVDNLARDQMNSLQSYVKGGGGLLLAPADRVDGADFNRNYGELTPALLRRKHVFNDETALAITQVHRHHSIIRFLQNGQPTDFGAARFHGYWRTEPVAGSDVILSFENGDAALVAKRVGNGRVLLFTSSLDPEWNNFPRQVTYLPLLHESMRYLAGSQDQKTVYRVGEFVPLSIAPGGAARVTSPQGEETLLRSTPAGPAFYRATDQPGFYETRSGNWLSSFAVNVSAQESDLTAIALDDIRDRVAHSEAQQVTSHAEQISPLRIQLEKSQQSWWWILLLVLVLGLFETFLANRTYR
jgi:hypothetical protein